MPVVDRTVGGAGRRGERGGLGGAGFAGVAIDGAPEPLLTSADLGVVPRCVMPDCGGGGGAGSTLCATSCATGNACVASGEFVPGSAGAGALGPEGNLD